MQTYVFNIWLKVVHVWFLKFFFFNDDCGMLDLLKLFFITDDS